MAYTPPVVLLLLVAQEIIRSADPPFVVRIPSGYQADPVPPGAPPGSRLFRRPTDGELTPLSIRLTPLPDEIASGHPRYYRDTFIHTFRRSGLPESALIGSLETMWQDHEIGGSEIQWTDPEGRRFLQVYWIPTQRRALEVMILGPGSSEAQVKGDMQAILSSLSAESPWISAGQLAAIRRISMLPGLGLLLALLYAIIWLVCYRRRPTRAHVLRTAWLAVIGLLIGAGVLAWHFTVPDALRLWIPPPLFLQPLYGGAACVLFHALAGVRLLRFGFLAPKS